MAPGRPERVIVEGEPALMRDPVIIDLLERHGAKPANVLIAWALHRGTVVIPKSIIPQRLKQNLSEIDLNLTPEDGAQIDKLDLTRRDNSGKMWTIAGSPYTQDNLRD